MRDSLSMIYDDSGLHIGWIENGDAFSATTRKKVACVKNNELFSVDGERLNMHLQNAFRARGQNDTTPAMFLSCSRNRSRQLAFMSHC